DPIMPLDPDATASSTSLKPTQHEHAVAEIANLARDQDELLPGIVQALEVLFDALASPDDLILDARHRRDELEVGSHEIVKGVNVAPVEGCDAPLDDLHVLLRNTPSPARKLRVFIRRGSRRQ